MPSDGVWPGWTGDVREGTRVSEEEVQRLRTEVKILRADLRHARIEANHWGECYELCQRTDESDNYYDPWWEDEGHPEHASDGWTVGQYVPGTPRYTLERDERGVIVVKDEVTDDQP